MPRAKVRVRVCKNCDKEYSLDDEGSRHKYCSEACYKKKHAETFKTCKRDYRSRMTYWLRHKYGITLEDRDQMLEEQGGCCAICRTDTPTGYNWHVDHCHETGKVRGLLCSKCNQALGLVFENVQTLRSMITYVENHR